jgi:hypothetical protein
MMTREKGLILKPTEHSFISFICYVDALTFKEVGTPRLRRQTQQQQNPDQHTLSCTTYGGCLIAWASKIQSDIALSITESEYSALSEA